MTESPEVVSSPAAPPSERYPLIDALRGFALAGVLLVNLGPLTLYEFLDAQARAALPTAGFDRAALQGMEALVNIKAATLFSLLFGLGFALQLDRARARGRGGVGRFVWRLLILAALGLAHGYLLWWGDILLLYALVGLLLVLFRRAPDRVLLSAGLFIALAVPPLLSPWVRELLAGLPKRGAFYARTLEAFSSPSWAEALRHNVAVMNWSSLLNWALVCFVLGRFLLGYWAGRRQLFQRPDLHRDTLRRLFLGTLGVGVAMTALAFVQEPLMERFPLWKEGVGRFGLRVAWRTGPLALGVAYACGFALLFLRPAWRRRLEWLVPAGRMALTHYLTQSVLGVGLFYGAGLGLGPRWGVAGWLLAWGLIFSAQVAASHWWLARFRFGPLEWLWRSLTYGTPQPMRREPPLSVGRPLP
ncbi:DUF418 domain-containing protein [Stigmatella hybrida]|uniref:DUF418 domain-containing protein n=1 Tax=Stigmatella hybrida TaxID=394097 RepID=UPI001CDAACFE|nr:DUF418 domain-containing protein [Stigmatella hybrida]